MAPGWRWSRTAARVINARPMMPSKNCVADLPVEFQNLPIMDSSCARCINATFYSIPQLAADAPRPGHVADHQHAKVRELSKLPEDFVVHSLRHTMSTRPGIDGKNGARLNHRKVIK